MGYNDQNFVEHLRLRKFHEIQYIKIDDKFVNIMFVDGVLWRLETESDCCAHHYMSTDDDTDYVTTSGAVLVDVDLVDLDSVESDEWGGCHEMMALKIVTSKGVVTAVAHNEHNGYYGGFSIYSYLI